MPAELLLLLIVAFASPSCQVLSSLRMGEALQHPHLLETLPLGPELLWEPRHASPPGLRILGFGSQLQHQGVPGPSSPSPGSRSLDP
jgi:hypothetical protein